MLNTNEAQKLSRQSGVQDDCKENDLMQYFKLVKFVARKFMYNNNPVLEESDLIQYGMIGLLDAAKKFNPSRGVKFETYAITRIQGSIQDELRKLDPISRSTRKKMKDIARTFQELVQKNGREPYPEEIAKELSINLDEYYTITKTASKTHMDKIDCNNENLDVNELVSQSEPENPFEYVSSEETRKILLELISRFPENERIIISLYYYEGLSFKMIAKVIRLSESRVSQIHASVLSKMRHILKELNF